jgi:hypothetical protein
MGPFDLWVLMSKADLNKAPARGARALQRTNKARAVVISSHNTPLVPFASSFFKPRSFISPAGFLLRFAVLIDSSALPRENLCFKGSVDSSKLISNEQYTAQTH